jgi:hypothetical protein
MLTLASNNNNNSNNTSSSNVNVNQNSYPTITNGHGASQIMSELNSSLTTPRSRAPIALTGSKTAESLIFNEHMNELAASGPLSPSAASTAANNVTTNGNAAGNQNAYNNGIYNIQGQLILDHPPGHINHHHPAESGETPYLFLAGGGLNTKGIC